MRESPRAERVLVIRLGAIGDVVRTLPAARRLRSAYADARLDWLVEPAAASLLEGQRWIDRVHIFPRGHLRDAIVRGRFVGAARQAGRFVRALRAERFDLVVDFHAILKSGALSAATGAPFRVSYARPFAREGAAVFANHRALLAPPKQSRFERNAALVDFLAVPGTAASEPAPFDVDEAVRARMRDALGGERPVAIHPGTSAGTPHKRWNVEGYAAFAKALAAKGGPRSIVTAGPDVDEIAFADAIVAASGGSARRAPETPSLLDLAALFAESALYVGSDTGPMHLASLVGTKIVQLLGPTDPIENAPWPGTPSRTVRVQIACNPCRRGCAAATCMQVISPDAVLSAAGELLATDPGGW